MMASFGVQEIVAPDEDEHSHEADGTSMVETECQIAEDTETTQAMDHESDDEDDEDDDDLINLAEQKNSSAFATSLRSKGFLWMAGKQSMFSWSAAGVYVQLGPEGR
jgi:G3E family GTPase